MKEFASGIKLKKSFSVSLFLVNMNMSWMLQEWILDCLNTPVHILLDFYWRFVTLLFRMHLLIKPQSFGEKQNPRP